MKEYADDPYGINSDPKELLPPSSCKNLKISLLNVISNTQEVRKFEDR